MRIKTTMGVLLGCAWLTLAQSPDPVREALERGLAAEESTRDLAGAAKAYTDAVAAADARRATHATALFRLAEVQRRQGKTNEATELYRRVLAEFPDQAEMVAASRRHVGEARPAAGGSGNSLALQRLGMRHQDLLQAERDLSLATDRLNHYQNLNEDQRLQWLAREVPTSRARMLLEKIATSQQELATLITKVGPGHPDRQAAESLLKAIEDQVFQETSSAREALQSEMTFHKGRLAGLADQVRQLEKETAVSPGMPGGTAPGPSNEAEQLLEDEIRVAEQQLLVEQRKFEAGRGETEEVLKAQRDVLNLKRQLAEKRQRRDLLDVSPSVGNSKTETPETSPPALDEEEKEIARLQGLYRNSPDLLNNPGPNGLTPLARMELHWNRPHALGRPGSSPTCSVMACPRGRRNSFKPDFIGQQMDNWKRAGCSSMRALIRTRGGKAKEFSCSESHTPDIGRLWNCCWTVERRWMRAFPVMPTPLTVLRDSSREPRR